MTPETAQKYGGCAGPDGNLDSSFDGELLAVDDAYDHDTHEPVSEDVPSSVELRWRPDDHQAAVTVSS